LSIAVSGTSEVVVLRHLDLIALALALPLFVIAELPVGGWALGAGVWLAQRGLQLFFQSRVRRTDDPKAVVGYTAGGAIARGWLAALAVLVVGILAGDDVGLSAVVLILVLFTVYFGGRLLQRAGAQGAR
jgi:hypothetical protein